MKSIVILTLLTFTLTLTSCTKDENSQVKGNINTTVQEENSAPANSF